MGLHNERIVNTIPALASNPTSHIEHYERGFLTEELRTTACQYLNNCKNFVNKGTRQTLFFSQNDDTPAPIAAIINNVNEKFEIHDNNKINSVTVKSIVVPKLNNLRIAIASLPYRLTHIYLKFRWETLVH